MPRVEFELTIPLFERSKTVFASELEELTYIFVIPKQKNCRMIITKQTHIQTL